MVRFCGACGGAVAPVGSPTSLSAHPQFQTSRQSGMSLGKKAAFVGASLFAALIVATALYQATPEGKAAVAAQKQERADQETQRQQDDAEREKHQAAADKQGAISAASLKAAYDQNEVNADNQYKGKVVVVQGRVGTIGKNVINMPYVTLDEDQLGIGSIHCFFDKASNAQLAKLRPGQTIFIRGTVDGLSMLSVDLNDCTILD